MACVENQEVVMRPSPGDVLRRKGGWSPLIRVIETDLGLAVEKDYSAKPLAIRATIARVLARHEREIFPLWIGRGLRVFPAGGVFLDIGTPDSYGVAQSMFAGGRAGHDDA
jgi:hypothetical protein